MNRDTHGSVWGLALGILLLVGSAASGGEFVKVHWWNWADGALYDADGSALTSPCLFQLVLDRNGDTALSAMVADHYWAIGAEASETGVYGSDDDVTLGDQNGLWTDESGAWGGIDVDSAYDEAGYKSKPFYVRFFNAGSTGAATQAGLIYDITGTNWVMAASALSPDQKSIEIGRTLDAGGTNPDLAGSTDGMHLGAWATMRAGGAPAANRLTVVSAHGDAVPAPGVHGYPHGTSVTGRVSRVQEAGGTRYTCTGWAMTGNEPLNGPGTNCVMTLTNNATMTWLWATEMRLTVAAGPNGSVEGSSPGWYVAGASVCVTATPASGYLLAGWTGDVPPAQTAQNPLSLTMDQPRSVTAAFAGVPSVTHPRGTIVKFY
jgi:hypothetical protein